MACAAFGNVALFSEINRSDIFRVAERFSDSLFSSVDLKLISCSKNVLNFLYKEQIPSMATCLICCSSLHLITVPAADVSSDVQEQMCLVESPHRK